MKISASIRRLHEDQTALNARLRLKVDERIRNLRRPNWHYESRLKNELSFALKLESGRVRNPEALEDFFAGTVVVGNSAEIAEAERLVVEAFTPKYRRPPDGGQTHKSSDAFPFDDLRLYLTLKANAALPPSDLDGVVFELQVKTFLQHAWSIATHSLIYKSDDVDWSKERIAYQVKAMLEHAEVSIHEAHNLANSSALRLQNKRTQDIRSMIALLRLHWSADALPADLRRLAENISELLGAINVATQRLDEILANMKTERGELPTNLSPHGTVLQGLLQFERDKLLALLRSEPRKARVLVPSEVDFDAAVPRDTLRNAIFI